ncbi:SDR family oxidoreductase [Bradyrhizobium cenepequi]|uniref:SDR family oxidoreductase n=1 Tax=Bradyrhizobium cenepequi TaxID=2821403 RepID=UPI001CE2C7E9|nr:SDR family oxidoreductase [Bradyrhizobium cenepequi]
MTSLTAADQVRTHWQTLKHQAWHSFRSFSRNTSSEFSDPGTRRRGRARHNVPLQRLGLPQDVAQLAAFLTSNRANYITGCTIDCNGGWAIS